MKQLTFGEQLKVILSRRGMTIKALAELIEEETGKKMSRQNLTQRLGRDNFQEQDMRMIAEILDCSFTLNILPVEELEKAPGKITENVSVQQELFKNSVEEIVAKETPIKVEPTKEISIEEEPVREEKPLEKEKTSEEKDEHIVTVGELKDMSQELTDLEREADFRAKGIFLRVKGVDVKQVKEEHQVDEDLTVKEKVEQRTLSGSREPEAEAVVQGEINPYTGKEYETNSVRTHPNRIGYVQVYDSGIHRWKDMTEWAFLGYQERKKAILGSRYEEPIYLD
jgi:hypothetical protein